MGSREVKVTLRADISQYQRALATAAAETQAFGRSTSGLKGPLGDVEKQSSSTGREIDRLSGRLRLAADAALILGPALGPLGAAAVGGVVALSAQLGALAGGLGVTLLAVNGLGDGLKAMDKYQLEPTTENFKKMQQELEKLGPAGEDFVRFLDSIEPNLKTLQNAAREGLLPGAQEGIENLMQRLPELRKLIRDMSETMGSLFSDAGGAIGGPRFDAFFKYLRTDGVKILDDTGRAIGNLAESAANLFAAFGGVSTDFSGGLLKFTEGLAEASANLGSNAGFQEFVDYIETEGPHALETLGSLGNALLQIVEATAPLGGPVLTVLGKFADIIAAIADSDIGTPIFAGLAALALFNRSLMLTASLSKATWAGPGVKAMQEYKASLGTVITAQDRATMSAKELAAAEAQRNTAQAGLVKGIGKGAALVGGLAIATSGLTEKTGLSNAASMALMGTIAGPWGAAIGGGVGLAIDFAHANDGLTDSLAAVDAAAASGNLEAYAESLENARNALHEMQVGQDKGMTQAVLGPLGGLTETPEIWSKISGATGDAEDRLKAAEQAFKDAEQAQENMAKGVPSLVAPLAGLRVGLQQATEAQQEQTTAINAAVEAMRAQREEALRAANAELDYQQSIDDAKDALKENGRTVDETTDKGRANLRALYNLAGAWNGQSDVIKDNAGALRTARQNFIDTAESMGMTREAARKLSRELFEIPTKRQIDITMDTHGATADLIALKARMDAIKSKTVRINVVGGPHAGGQTATDEQVPNRGAAPKRAGGKASTSSNSAYDIRNGGLGAYRGRGGSGGGSGDGSGGYTPFMAVNEHAATAAEAAATALRRLQAALAKSEKSLDKERSARDNAQAQMEAFSTAVGGAYSTMDPFAAPSGSGWGAGGGALSTFDKALSGNIASTTAAQSALGTAAGNGLDGPLYQALAQSGNLALLQAFAGLSAAEIDKREQQFAAQSNAQSALGAGAAAAAGLTAQVAISNEKLIDIKQEVRELRRDVKTADANNQKAQDKNAKDVKNGVNGAATAGHGRGR